MEGTMWKWTNYLSGWQPRWFVLDGGCLSYYLSPGEVHLGSRGALKVSSCDIIVHHSDHQRMDMVMPGGRHIYLRAASMSERQQWLLSLGVAKQGGVLSDTTEDSKRSASGTLHKKVSELQASCQLLVSQVASIRTLTATPTSTEAEVLETLSSQVSETCDNFLHILQECMDLSLRQPLTPVTPLMPLPLEQLYAPKRGGGLSPGIKPKGFSESELYAAKPKTTPTSENATPTHMKSLPLHLLDSSDKLKEEVGVSRSLPIVTHLEPRSEEWSADSLKPSPVSGSRATVDSNSTQTITSEHVSKEATTPENDASSDESLLTLSSSADEVRMDSAPLEAASVLSESGASPSSNSKHSRSHSTSDFYVTPVSSPPPSPDLPHPRERRIKDRIKVADADEGRRHHTFFSSLSVKFEDMEVEDGDFIPTQPFLQRCQLLLPFFDMLHSTAFAPVKSDINGNIAKLMRRYEGDPEAYHTLQAMVDLELQSNSHTSKNSATDALLWLKRAMEFVCHFIGEVAGGEQSLDVAAGKAYSLSLRRHHNWIVRGIFNLAMKAVPYHKDLLRLLGSLGTDEGERQVILDMAVFSASLGELVSILNAYYQLHELETPPQL